MFRTPASRVRAMENIVLLACLTGFISAVSLPIGSAIGLATRPNAKITSALMAFGGGALLFALTIEIVAHSFELAGFWPLAVGCVIGGLLYELLNHGLNSMGAFFRKTATVIRQTARWRAQRAEAILRKLLGVPMLQTLDPAKIAALVPHVDELDLEENTVVFRAGTRPDAFYLIESGRVEIIMEGKTVAVLGPGEVFGEIGLMADRPRTGTAVTQEDCQLYRVTREDFNTLVDENPEVKKVLRNLMDQRSRELVRKSLVGRHEARLWKKRAAWYLKHRDLQPTSLEVDQAMKQHGPATLGIWLGILLDGIPESIVIGISVTIDKGLPLPLVAGVFLSNLPEAMSSSVLMNERGYSRSKILLMWMSIAVMTALGAVVGNMFFQSQSMALIAVLEGMAAGAMLTMIAETMLPEAYEHGGAIVGLATLAGFLAALYVKYLSH